MNSLLKRQIRKYLSDELASNKNMEPFLSAIDSSYNNFNQQFNMLQRALGLSSEELFTANKQLREESLAQQEVINKLKRVIETLKFYDLPEHENKKALELDGLKLVEFIDNQTKEIVEINKQREKLLGELAYQNQELSDYAHMVSHDLKSPLRSIDSLTAWLKEDYHDVIDSKGKENLEFIRNNVQKMDLLINGILEYSTIGKSQLGFYNVDIDNLLKDIIYVIDVPEHISIHKKVTLPVIKGNKYSLQQLFQNLITNAINYNDKEKGLVEIGCEDQNEFWLFYVKDNGMGIDKKNFEKIFKTFQQLENRVDSTGIGLAIVKKIVDLYDGKIWLESTVGVGSTFFFTLKKQLNGTA